MKLLKITILGFFLSIGLSANDSFNSEFSHFAGGAVMAGATTTIVDMYFPEYRKDRGMIGFEVSSFAIIAEQAVEYAMHGGLRNQALDAGSHILGSALGAYITDKYLLSPILEENKLVGLSVKYTF